MIIRKQIIFFFIFIVIGFTISIQFQSIQQPSVPDSRDVWQLRQDLIREKQLESDLIVEIRKYEETLENYKIDLSENQATQLQETLYELNVKSGKIAQTGIGLVLTIEPILESTYPKISDNTLRMLINELNQLGATAISIDGIRLVNGTVIRQVNRETRIDNYLLRNLPFEIKLLGQSQTSVESIYKYLQVSRIHDLLYFENLRLIISNPKEITVPESKRKITIDYIEIYKPE